MEEPRGIPNEQSPERFEIVIQPNLWEQISNITEESRQRGYAKLTPEFARFLRTKRINASDGGHYYTLMEMDSDAGFQVVGRPDGTGVFSIQLYPGDDVNIMRQLITDDYQIFKKHIEEYILRKRAGESLTTKLALGKEQGPGQGKEKDVLGQVVAMGYTTGEKGSSDIVLERLKTKLKGGRKTRGKRKGKKASRKTRRRS